MIFRRLYGIPAFGMVLQMPPERKVTDTLSYTLELIRARRSTNKLQNTQAHELCDKLSVCWPAKAIGL